MDTKVTTKSGNVKPIAKKTSISKETAKRSVFSIPTNLKKPPQKERTGPFPENSLPTDNTEERTADCPHFYNNATDSQLKYVKELIENRIQKEGIDFKDPFISFAGMFDFELEKAHWASSSIKALLKVIYKEPSILNALPTYERQRALKTLERFSIFLDWLRPDYAGVLFDLSKIETSWNLQFREVLQMQDRHLERRIVDDGVFAFDLAFKIPFEELSEDAKVDRLKIYLKEHTGWTDDPVFLPEHVKKYLPKAEQLLKGEQ